MIVMLVVLAITMAINVPIAVSLGLGGIAYLVAKGQTDLLSIVAPRMFAGMNSFELLAIPMFVLSGDIMYQGRVSKALVDLARVFVGRIKGGMSAVTTLACMFFGAVSGSGPATASAIGSVVAPDMKEEGYPPEYTAAVISASGPLGALIPPSIMMVTFGATTNTSVGKLLLGGVGAGVLFGAFTMIYSWWTCGKRGFGVVRREKLTLRGILRAFREAAWALVTPLIILGGIYGGIFTPTEAAAVSVAYSLFLVLVVYRSVKLRDLPALLARSAETAAGVMFVVGAVAVFGWVLTREQIPQMLARAAIEHNLSQLTLLVIINIAFLIAGMFMNGSAAILLLMPVFMPIVSAMKIDPVFLGVMIVANLCIGMMTPPVALSLYVACRITKAQMSGAIRETIPFVFVQVVALAVLVLCPPIATYLPALLFGK